eukprot:TRINITY_DN71154_c0_g1_i1.p1 TRINITY_DN71154_c0_g1~~TRINITY_DN71154_c0_g1_i1.p1  ORF type:complete len:535 (-),score=55.37 TRINITY_DN71154_c0_g1_i1:204-1781(-)
MAPEAWKQCPACHRPYSPASFELHFKRCVQRQQVVEEHRLREDEYCPNLVPLSDWVACSNCGNRYGPTAIAPHIKRCTRLHNAGYRTSDVGTEQGHHHTHTNGKRAGSKSGNVSEQRPQQGQVDARRASSKTVGGVAQQQQHHTTSKLASQSDGAKQGVNPFVGLWGVGDRRLDKLRKSFSRVCHIHDTPDFHDVKALFRKWDLNGDGQISKSELTQLIRHMGGGDLTNAEIDVIFDAADTKRTGYIDKDEFLVFLYGSQEISLTDVENEALRHVFDRFSEDGTALKPSELTTLMHNMFPAIANDFVEEHAMGKQMMTYDVFVRHWLSHAGKPKFNANELDEVGDMFHYFDKDDSGEIDQHEFLVLLDNLFPEHCEENREHLEVEFAACDTANSEVISFSEFLAYYECLKKLYGDEGPRRWPPADAADRSTSLDSQLMNTLCGLQLLPDRLAPHQRSCQRCKQEIECRGPWKPRHAEASELELCESVSADDAVENSFAPKRCRYCPRIFFADRLVLHERVCKHRT